ncbi:hypothetical protein H257_11268 [Aphanomyces astaci]|uniref:Uncharacterized protein n=1 Tax=Aphanomyces astaci TaxID=112090 RepID=W4G3T9_APHAT|nr:hypothetical protein H257_11268 [Aphanomyces astaci]ETV73951.1 hypothetical protein H257_11268 [Aphanomyces astaci]|eukprot:XP_009836464.1 hypothetical protein H257_11268 [Aphanomyces astaci]
MASRQLSEIDEGLYLVARIVMRLAAVAVDIFVSVAAESNRFNISDANLFFNRVASTVWIGRPLLVLLGLVVVLVLSMCQVPLFQRSSGLTRLQHTPRPILSTMILVGEATWLSYMMHDTWMITVSSGADSIEHATQSISNRLLDTIITLLRIPGCLGSKARLAGLVTVQAASFVVAYVGLKVWRAPIIRETTAPLVMHTAAAVHLQPTNGKRTRM